jgi:hypothetical protein
MAHCSACDNWILARLCFTLKICCHVINRVAELCRHATDSVAYGQCCMQKGLLCTPQSLNGAGSTHAHTISAINPMQLTLVLICSMHETRCQHQVDDRSRADRPSLLVHAHVQPLHYVVTIRKARLSQHLHT